MGGPNLELFKFGVYIFFPVAVMYYVGSPSFYEKHVKETKVRAEKTHHPLTTRQDIMAELEKLQAKKK
ncbi:hypothetical protein C2G38_2210889 [Gigaspora rosea]|uniref:Protein PET100, mitochondrial n=1 Tax=Gigaspora rosea TaxID=44941 RepID=A0A397UNL7_9GLOM|nr:hypothetical protein C2G38_2210889 [Gigaspora rosea]CAG8643674.1 18178_t:CDS:2 [Gigaspora rosea]